MRRDELPARGRESARPGGRRPLIARVMRELGRRVKKLAYGWKPKGIEKVTRILLRIFTDEEEWERHWRERMRISQSVALTFRIVKAPA